MLRALRSRPRRRARNDVTSRILVDRRQVTAPSAHPRSAVPALQTSGTGTVSCGPTSMAGHSLSVLVPRGGEQVVALVSSALRPATVDVLPTHGTLTRSDPTV